MKWSLPVLTAATILAFGMAHLPAVAETNDEHACASTSADASAGPIDLDKIPAKPVAGAPSIVGGADDCGALEHADNNEGGESADLDD